MPTMSGLNKTWTDLTSGTGILRCALNFGMTVGVCVSIMFMACEILVHAPKLLVPVVTLLSIALVSLPIFGAAYFDNLARKIICFEFKNELIFKFIPNALLHELSIVISSATHPTPFAPPRRIA